MNAETALSNLGLAQATVATLGTVMIVGLGFLHRPSRSTLLWSLAFGLAMTSTWVAVTGAVLEVEAVRRVGLGLMLGAPALVWSGFRARRGVRAHPWIAGTQSVATAVVLAVVTDPRAYGVVFRIAFFAAAVFAALTLTEIRRAADRTERLALPLVVVSAGFAVLGAAGIISAIVTPNTAADLATMRLLNGLAMLVYLVCATVSLLYFASVSPVGAGSAVSWPQFTVSAADRLARARAAHEASWSVLSIRLDDPDQIRGVAGDAAWLELCDEFERLVRTSFPAEADIGRAGRGRMTVVVSRPDAVLREHVRDVLARITEIDSPSHTGLRVSASVGWVPAESAGYDLAELVASADAAAESATRGGGDRWERLIGS